MDKILITTGDFNGIGAEVTIKALNSLSLPIEKITIVSNKKILDFYGKLNLNYDIIEVPFNSSIEVGHATKESGEFSYQALKLACELKPKAIVTAPVAKNALHLAGHKFNGQTEIIEHFLAHDGQKAEMLFVSDNFRVLLLTRHVALKDINLTTEMVVDKILNLNKFFINKLKISQPKFALCGFNPHSGESGILGREEIEILNPAINILRKNDIDITNPLPSDTLFSKLKYINGRWTTPYDCYIANYHDQGLIPIKSLAQEKTVNMTIGLDIIRTSPAHGTAFDIAGQNIANPESMIEAIKTVL